MMLLWIIGWEIILDSFGFRYTAGKLKGSMKALAGGPMVRTEEP